MIHHLSHLPEVRAATEAAAACDTIEALDAAIRAFDAHETCRTPAMPGRDGARYAGRGGVMILGKAPAGTEIETRRPFSGPAGVVLREEMEIAGFDLEVCRISCASPWRARRDNNPNATQIAISRPFLFREIELVRPDAIVALGDKATDALFQDGSYSLDAVGVERTFAVGDLSVPVLVTYNNAFVMYGRAARAPTFRRHLTEMAARHEAAFASTRLDPQRAA